MKERFGSPALGWKGVRLRPLRRKGMVSEVVRSLKSLPRAKDVLARASRNHDADEKEQEEESD